MKPYGLVLAGGGAKGAYQIGAWKAMRELGIEFEAVAGVSIGSINGALIVSGDYEAAINMWNSVSVAASVRIDEPLHDPDNLFSRKNWGVLFKEVLKNGGFDASPVKAFLEKYIDEEKVRKSEVPFGIVTVQMTQGVTPLELFCEDIPDGQLVDYLLASSNIPLANNIGPEGERFLDGGAYDNTPVQVLRKNGYNRLIMVDISSFKGVNRNPDLNNCEVVYIRPHDIDDLGASFDFDSELNEKRMKLGYFDTFKAFSYLLGNIYYFKPDVFRSMLKKYGTKAVLQLEEMAYKLKLPLEKIYGEEQFIAELKELYEKDKELKTKEEKDEKNPDEVQPSENEHSGLYASVQNYLSKKKFGPKAIAQFEELSGKIKQMIPEISSDEELLSRLKELFDNDKDKRPKTENETELTDEKTQEKDEHKGIYSSLIKAITKRKNEPEFPEAVAVLDGIIF